MGYTTAAFDITGREASPRWPESLDPFIERTPVYLALKDSFEPDMSRMLTPEQAAEIADHARRYAELAGRASKAPEPADDSEPRNQP